MRDQRSGNIEVKSGLAAGDTVLRSPSSNLKDGQSVQMADARVASAAPAQPIKGK
jgi:membrane fusion protein (multidrug efflux system)